MTGGMPCGWHWRSISSLPVPVSPSQEEACNERAKRIHVMPVGAYGPEHVANTVNFICSDAAAHISADVFDIAAAANAHLPV